jgi:hypothetical protein
MGFPFRAGMDWCAVKEAHFAELNPTLSRLFHFYHQKHA